MKAVGRAWAGKRDKAKMLLEFGEGLGGALEASLGLGSDC